MCREEGFGGKREAPNSLRSGAHGLGQEEVRNEGLFRSMYYTCDEP